MKKPFLIIWIAAVSACSSGGAAMTAGAFYEITIGSSQSEVLSSAGEPYAIRHGEDGTIEYEYIERFKVGGRNSEEKHYYVVMKDGKVISKRVAGSSPYPYTFDSYEMQTTEGGA